MTILFEILFWISVSAIFHSYVIFPITVKILAKRKKINENVWLPQNNNLPKISIITAAFNEEKSIEKKIISTLQSDYPSNKIEFLIGSDCSTDKTDKIIEEYAKKDNRIIFKRFNSRSGKVKIINELSKTASGEILILTDAKVFFGKKTVYHLIKHFKNNDINIVGGVPVNNKINPENISKQENSYMNREIFLKYKEGIISGNSMGIFGALYAIRKNCFPEIPENFLVDDFFVTLKILQQNGKIIFEPKAVANQTLAGNIGEEFKRKVRISAGNFQNLFYFKKMLIPKSEYILYFYLSHKVLRWLSPFLIPLSVLSNILIIKNHNIYFFTFVVFLISILNVFIDIIFQKIKINIKLLRFFTHFYLMNIALLVGFIKYLKGIKSAIWQPSVREI